jgi:hypothetical protein
MTGPPGPVWTKAFHDRSYIHAVTAALLALLDKYQRIMPIRGPPRLRRAPFRYFTFT